MSPRIYSIRNNPQTACLKLSFTPPLTYHGLLMAFELFAVDANLLSSPCHPFNKYPSFSPFPGQLLLFLSSSACHLGGHGHHPPSSPGTSPHLILAPVFPGKGNTAVDLIPCTRHEYRCSTRSFFLNPCGYFSSQNSAHFSETEGVCVTEDVHTPVYVA